MLSWLLGAEAARRAHSRSLVREQLEPLNCRGLHCTARFTHRPVSVPGEGAGQSWPCLSLGKCLPEDASQALCACFLTDCKFFLFKTLTFSRLSVSSSSFVRQAYAVCSGGTKRGCRREPKWLRTGSAPGFSLEPGQAREPRGGSEAHRKPATASFFC